MISQGESALRFTTSKKKMLIRLIGASVLVAMGYWIFVTDPIIGWFAMLFFGLCGLIAVVAILPNSSYVELSSQGFLMCSLYRKWFIRWSDVREFRPIEIHGNSMVGWTYLPGYETNGLVRKTGRKASFAIAGVDAGFPDTYGMTANELATLLNEWREKYGQASAI